MVQALVAIAAGIAIVWGLAHIAPTRQVVASFGDIGTENRTVLTMEWVAEGLTLIFLGVLPLIVMITVSDDSAARTTYRLAAGMLIVLAAWTAVTGARTSVVFFKACPIVKSSVAALLLVASVL